ncbi:MAG TPA: ABC transporter permease [Bacteroidales bacterium]|nr:ABC transporter permease [Bacteroidales bacterium]
MLRNYLKTAMRNIRRFSVHSILNVFGLATGMACAILILLWIRYEVSFDRFRKNKDNLYRVITTETWGGRLHRESTSPFPLAAALKDQYPDIIRSTRFHTMQISLQKGENLVKAFRVFADKDFLDMFDIEFIKGDKSSALLKPNDILITEELAHKYFGEENPVGQTMIQYPNQLFTVTGVVKNVPKNSNFFFDCVMPAVNYSGEASGENVWGWQSVYNYTFVQLRKGTDIMRLQDQFRDIIQRNRKQTDAVISLQKIREIHLNAKKLEGDFATGNIAYVRFAILLAFLILAVACLNFMNLLTAQSTARAKEIGIRKITGATKQKIVFQFLGESLLIVFIAHILAMIMVELLLPGFNNLLHMKLSVNYLSLGLYLSLAFVILFTGLISGSYPAFYLSSLNPLDTIKNIPDKKTGKTRIRKILVIAQFTFSFLFIISTIIVRKQLNYITDANLGQNIDNLCYFGIPEGIQSATLKNELNNVPGIRNITITNTFYQSIINHQLNVGIKNWKGKTGTDTVLVNGLSTDKNYAATFGLVIKAGQYLDADEFNENPDHEINIVINEKAQLFFGIMDPLGEQLTSSDGRKLNIIGVVKDFNYRSLRIPIEPLIIFPIGSNSKSNQCYIKMKAEQTDSTLTGIRNKVKLLKPDYMLDLKFVQDDFKGLYTVERVIATFLGFMSILAIIISCLGLIGLSTFMTMRRIKEIGIRKVNGGSPFEIFTLLSKEYIRLILIAFVIASPLSFYATNMWLRGFAYRTPVNWPVFALAFVIVVVFTILTVGFQSWKASNKNPVEALKYE